ncbi:MAG: nucleotidyltransferase and HEPN domain-containing protein [Kordiimonadaceae bacterium]|nr:nucleotidyltransferase and HEPN domain-containing protein [Kordiimonadaceae bacterium]
MTDDLPLKLVFDLGEILPHLPPEKQAELSRALRIIFEEFEDARVLATSETKRMGRILHVVLFGSFTGDNWVEDPKSGYMSDFDLLIVVNNQVFTDCSTYWYKAEERLLRNPSIRREVNFIVHDLGEVNSKLCEAQYFFSDIVREGIPLYELTKTKPLKKPGILDEAEAKRQARRYFEGAFSKVDSFQAYSQLAISRGELSLAAFLLHQAVEAAYNCLLLVYTLYSPASHNIKFLRSLSENLDDTLIGAWPRTEKADRATFSTLKRAYVDARYSSNYEITKDQLNWLLERVKMLEELVKASCAKALGL